jgi:uncharacterized peroxidase-related enzyme
VKHFTAVALEGSAGRPGELLKSIENRLGMTPNFLSVMAVAPAVLDGYNSLSCILEKGVLPVGLREQVALVVSEMNSCPYCIAAHSAIARTVGLNEDEVMDSRQGISPDSKVAAALRFARIVVESCGRVPSDEISRLARAGYSDEEIIEILANVILTIFTNYFNLIVCPDLDFPEPLTLPVSGADQGVPR